MKLSAIMLVFSAMLALLPFAAAAYGYGTSSISLTKSSVFVNQGGSVSVGYNVTLASGNTWGTNINIANQKQLSSQGISASLSNPGPNNPPFSGTLAVSAGSSVPAGSTWSVVLNATGDDPSVNNATLVLMIQSASSSTVGSGSSVSTAASSSVPTYTTAGGQKYGAASNPYSYGYSSNTTMLIIAIVVMLIIGAYFIMRMKPMSAKAIVIGILLILIGTAVWLYGDYNGGLMQYIWGGVAAILLGTVIWIYGDYIGGAFVMGKK